jgi:hypothetical protein
MQVSSQQLSACEPDADAGLRAWCAALCAAWGPGYSFGTPANRGAALVIRTPEQGVIGMHLRGDDIEFRTEHWPAVHEQGFKRSYAQPLVARISAGRDPEDAARDLQRRLLQPYAAALAEARRKAADFRRRIAGICDTLNSVGLGRADRVVLGRRLQAQKPHGALDHHGTPLPTTSVTTIALRDDDSAIGSVELRGLSLREIEALHGFIDTLVRQRQTGLRLAS